MTPGIIEARNCRVFGVPVAALALYSEPRVPVCKAGEAYVRPPARVTPGAVPRLQSFVSSAFGRLSVRK